MTKKILILTSVTAAALVGLAFLALGATHALAGPAAQSGAPELISYQGCLSDDAGQPISGTVDLQFGLYDAPSGGNPLWEETQSAVPVVSGYFAVLLGSANPLSAALFDAPTRYLEVRVDAGDGQAVLPRQPLAAVPYALHAEVAVHAATALNASLATSATQAPWSGLTGVPEGFSDGVDDDTLATLTCADGQIAEWNGVAWVCGADDNNAGGDFWSLTGNAGTLPGTHFLGTSDATSLTLAVSGTVALRLLPNSASPSLVGGYSGNSVAAGVVGAVISGGGTADIGYGNPRPNRVTDRYGVVAGGAGNQAGDDAGTPEDAAGATVGGGRDNTASGLHATVGGGVDNTASDLRATVGGGVDNTASGTSATVGGGFDNTASGTFATVAGGARANASHYGEMAYASGSFSIYADAQTSLYVLRNGTASATPTELFLDGYSQRLTVASHRVVTFDILVVAAHRYGGSSAGYQITGVIKNFSGATSFVGAPIKTVLGEDNASWDVDVIADGTNDALVIQVTGSNATTIRWVAMVRTVEVSR